MTYKLYDLFHRFTYNLSYRFGRKKALLVSYVTSTVFGFTSTFSSNFTMFAVMRFFTGLGLSGSSMVTVVLSEFYMPVFFLKKFSKMKEKKSH